jgi:hypothetical protein
MSIDLKIRAMTAISALNSAGITQYVPLIVAKHPSAKTKGKESLIREVANGRKTDLEITMWLEELVEIHAHKQSA